MPFEETIQEMVDQCLCVLIIFQKTSCQILKTRDHDDISMKWFTNTLLIPFESTFQEMLGMVNQ